jgi:pyruvate carboxylase
VRVDTWLTNGPYAHNGVVDGEWEVGTDFDSLLAKVIVRGRTFEEATAKARRVLRELNIGRGVKTNLSVLAGVVDHPEWAAGTIDTLWLERNAARILELGNNARASSVTNDRREESHAKLTALAPSSALSGNSILLQPGTLFNLALSVPSSSSSANPLTSSKHSLTLISISQNAFPSFLSGTLQTSFSPIPLEFSLNQSTSAAVSSDTFEFADLNNEEHIPFPITGKIVELHSALAVDSGPEQRQVRKGEPLLIVSMMKMESVISAPFDGTVERIGKGIKVGVVLGEGMLVCVLKKVVQSRL